MNDVEFCSYPCAICNSTDRTLIFRKEGQLLRRPFQIVRCRSCGHHFVDPRIRDQDLGAIYDGEYYHGRGFDPSMDFYADASAELLDIDERIIDMVAAAAHRPIEEMTWLDYGCGAGTILGLVGARGARAYGYDLGEPPRRMCLEKGLNILDDGAVARMAGKFDAVSAVEVIEHVPDPRGFVRHLTSLLKIGGVLFVRTGNWNLVRLVPGQPYVMPEGHLHYFSPATMRRVFATSGLREANVANVTWFGYAAMRRVSRKFEVNPVMRVLERGIRVVAPGYAQFPVGIRVC